MSRLPEEEWSTALTACHVSLPYNLKICAKLISLKLAAEVHITIFMMEGAEPSLPLPTLESRKRTFCWWAIQGRLPPSAMLLY